MITFFTKRRIGCREWSRRLSVEKSAAGCSRCCALGSLVGVRCRMKDARPGQVLLVQDDYHYPLPAGLQTGDVVRLVRLTTGIGRLRRMDSSFAFSCAAFSPVSSTRSVGGGLLRMIGE
jgi:hypothetical protein